MRRTRFVITIDYEVCPRPRYFNGRKYSVYKRFTSKNLKKAKQYKTYADAELALLSFPSHLSTKVFIKEIVL